MSAAVRTPRKSRQLLLERTVDGRGNVPAASTQIERATGRTAAYAHHPSYIHGSATGGAPGERGGHGLVIIRLYSKSSATPEDSSTVFYHTGRPQTYVVPETVNVLNRVGGNDQGVEFVEILAWGGGGGGGSTNHTHGGGGGFVQAPIRVRAGDVLTIFVGGGGESAQGDAGGLGGFHGGGAGGSGE